MGGYMETPGGEEKEKPRTVKIVRSGEYKIYDAYEGVKFEFLTRTDNLELLLITVAPQAESIEFKHPGEEGRYILEGELEITIENEVHRLRKGDAIWHLSNKPHSWRNPTDKPTKLISVATPRPSPSLLEGTQ
jgi:quercetin dioxygenase-like cupin family protein